VEWTKGPLAIAMPQPFVASVLLEGPLILDLELWRRRDALRLVRARPDLAEATVSMIALSWPPALGPL